MQYIGSNIRFIFTKIKELLNSHNTDNSAHSELFKSWKRLRNPNNADIADALAATYKNGIGDVLVEVKDDTTFALEDIKLFFRPASFKLISANESDYEGIYITMDGTHGRYVAKTFADSEIMMPEGPTTISTPSELVLYPAASDAVLYTPQTLTEEQKSQARTNIGALDENIETTPVDTNRTFFGVGKNIVYVKNGWLKPCPADADKELAANYANAVLGFGFINLDISVVKGEAKSAFSLYQQGLISDKGTILKNPLDVAQYITWTVGITNNKTYIDYRHVEHNGFYEHCRYFEDDTYSDLRASYSLSNHMSDSEPRGSVAQYAMSANPTEDMHVATKQYVDIAKTEAQQLGLTTATPGKTIKVKTVQDGKPTEWEAVDIYEKPDTGIPKTDLEQSVQTSLAKADTSISYNSQTLTEEQKSQARTNIGALDENIHTTEVDVKRTLNGIGTNLLYVRKGWLKPCPDDANDELISSYNTAVLFLNFTSITVDSVKRHAKGAYTIYQQGLASANLQFTDNPLDVERYISWDITTNNNKTYLTYQHYGHNGFSETCRYCVEDDSYDNVRVVNALNTRQTGDNPNATANQFYLATNPTKDMHIATKQYVDTAKTEAQQLGITAAAPGQIIKVKTVQDGKPTEWEAVDGGVQPDWNQNDETAADYVKNRPFYTGNPVETVLVEESTVTFAAVDGMYMGQLESTFSATIGETYKVSWDGAAYECTCVSFNDVPAIGNLSIMGAGSDTGEPFIMGILNGKAIQIATQNTSASHTFSISRLVTVVKIDPKYLPDTIATKSEVEAVQTAADDAWTEASNAQTTASNAQTTANNAQTTANNAQTTANNAKSEALDLAARMFGYTSVVDNAFYKDTTLSITSLPACIESIGNSAFYGCTNLALTSLPSGITSIGYSTFYDCKKLALTSLPSGLTSIGFSTFYGCTNLALTSLPSGLTSIGNNAFQGCKNLALTSLPSGITSIGSRTFYDCKKLALTSLPSGLTSIGEYAFYDCFNLALTSLPSGLTSIVAHAFLGCTGLTSITFTGKPTNISSLAFEGCANLTTINVPWAEGEVASAPWGATNATINYNYTGA